ncbi:hypothetical protein [Lentzea flaviverrucosa]|uniref:Uncharacterized protein n=1 Tax=Lentzea flaviverrucosa TaxID=200379 RepID=A0A1H9CAG9_9PSEU|nr:hypothetical protein [Lentzea flaviverrucosa]RDI24493.1 hypothetical protein DFR72_10973 [Lentzea flaviverrucosa]SEP98152.1 hypothetical protein SAMN05216195_101728 [Lentzea flaviverrucosa]
MNSINIPQLDGVVRALNQVTRNQEALGEQQVALHGAVSTVQRNQDNTQQELLGLKAQFVEYVRRDELRQNLQLAQVQILEVRGELGDKFGKFAEVRELATGTLQALDAGIVSQGAIRDLSEELMLRTPGYWLAPALIAVAAWIRDEPELATKAIGEALRRDNDKASLFFALVLRRHQRDRATAAWVRQYAARQDPAKLSPEFVVVLDAVSTGTFGREAKPMLLEQMSEWYGRMSRDQDTVDRQVGRWAKMIDTMRRPVDARYQLLPVLSPTWPQLKDMFEGATVHGATEEMLRATFDTPVPQSHDLHVRVDNILDGLVRDFDAEEAPYRKREAWLQAVVNADGDHDVAKKVMAAEDPLHEQTVDFLTLLSNAALHGDRAGASPGTQRFTLALARDWLVQGAGRLEAGNLASMPSRVELRAEGWTGWVDGDTDEQRLVGSLSEHVDRETEKAVSAVRMSGAAQVASVFGGFALLVALLSAVGGASGFALFMLFVAAALGMWAVFDIRALPARRAEIRRKGDQRRIAAVVKLRGAIAELVDLRGEWQREIAKAQSLRTFAEGLTATAFVATAPDQLRGA